MLRADIYGRYSSDNQRCESIDAQFRICREYCAKKGYVIINELKDEALTGTNDRRPSYHKLVDDARRGLIDVVVFHKIDRNARDEYDYYYHKMRLKKYGVRVEYAAQPIDSSPTGALMESILVGFAAYYSRNLAEEVRKGMHENAYQGLFNGGQPPLGYRIEDKKYVIDDHEAKAVKMIFNMYIAGHGYAAIIKSLNALGYKTRRGNSFAKTSLYDILANIRYTGTYVFGKNRNKTASGKRNQHAEPDRDCIFVENAVPAIISKEEFVQVAEIMKGNRRQPGKFTAKKDYLLSGLIYCGECGAAMQGTTTTSKRSGTHQYYRCGQKVRKGSSVCANKYVSLPELEDFVVKQIEDVIFSPKSVEIIVGKLDAAYKSSRGTIDSEREDLKKEKSKVMRRMDHLYDLIADGVADKYDLEKLREVKAKAFFLEERLEELNARAVPYLTREQIIKVIESFRSVIKSKDPENLRSVIQNFINKITVYQDEIVIEFKIKIDDDPSDPNGSKKIGASSDTVRPLHQQLQGLIGILPIGLFLRFAPCLHLMKQVRHSGLL